jgi:hypothetical protein
MAGDAPGDRRTRRSGRRPRPGHGDHGARRSSTLRLASLTQARRARATRRGGELTLDEAVAEHPFPQHPPEDARRGFERALWPDPGRARLAPRQSRDRGPLGRPTASIQERARRPSTRRSLRGRHGRRDRGRPAGERPRGRTISPVPRACPGLIDAHVHVGVGYEPQPCFGPPPVTARRTAATGGLGAVHPRRDRDRILRSGFTTVRDVGAYDDEVLASGSRSTTGLSWRPPRYTCARIVLGDRTRRGDLPVDVPRSRGPWEMRRPSASS